MQRRDPFMCAAALALLASCWPAGRPAHATPCPADLDATGDVGFADLTMLLSPWGPCGPPCAADLDADANVGFADLTLLLAAWGPCRAENEPPRIVSGTVDFTKQIIGTGVDETHFVVAADLDGDGDVDVVATDFVDDDVVWYENDGNGRFATRLLDGDLDGAYPLHLADVDGDGDTDVLATGYDADTVVWYENDGGASFTRRDVDTAANGAHSVVTGDPDQDGDVDLLTTNQDANTVTWYENDGALGFTRRTIDAAANGAKRADFADIDGDGDVDVVAASFFADEIAWYENDGNQSFTKRIIDDTVNGAYFVTPADLDGDGDVDLLTASQLDNTVAWYRNDGTGGFTGETIDGSAAGARTVLASDIDGDGDLDALAASVNDDSIAWHENDGSGSFTVHLIDFTADGAYGIFPTDMDHDGDVDVLSAQRDANTVALHTQFRMHTVFIDEGDTLPIGASLLQTIDADDGPSELTYTITAAPAFGELRVEGAAVPEGGTFTQADVDDDRVTYVHLTVPSTDGFSFTVADGGEGGVRPVDGRFTIVVNDPDSSLVVLPLDEGKGTVAGDVSGLGNDGVLVNGPVYEANTGDGSPFAVRFDGEDDYIDLGVIDVEGPGLTLAAWVNPDGGGVTDPRIISKATGTAADDHVFMLGTVLSGGATRLRTRVRVGGLTTTLIADNGNVQTGAWSHAAMTYDGSFVRLYLDGLEVGSAPLSGLVDVDPVVPVAVGSQPPGAGGRYFDGLLDDIRILDRAMSPAEIASIAAGPR